MKIGFAVNDIKTEEPGYTTTRLAMTAVNLGHKSYTFGVGDFMYAANGSIHARARTTNGKAHKSLEKFLKILQSDDAKSETICLDDLDVLLLRNDPSTDATDRPWAASSGILFGQLVARRWCSTIPSTLHTRSTRPTSSISPRRSDRKRASAGTSTKSKALSKEQNGRAVIKPLQGSGGKNVFLVGQDEKPT